MSGAKSMRDFIFMDFNFVCEKTKQISANSYTVREKISRMQSHSPKRCSRARARAYVHNADTGPGVGSYML